MNARNSVNAFYVLFKLNNSDWRRASFEELSTNEPHARGLLGNAET